MIAADVPPSPAHPLQNLSELGALWEFVAARPHARVLEIGSLYGGTLWYWSHLPNIETLVSIDLPTEDEGVHVAVREARSHWDEWFSPRVSFTDLSADSHDWQVANLLGDPVWSPFDFAFIDGDHTYGGIKQDWLLYSPLVRSGGIVAFHDTWPNYDRHEPGVESWVNELRHQLPSIQWTDPDGVGICAFTMP